MIFINTFLFTFHLAYRFAVCAAIIDFLFDGVLSPHLVAVYKYSFALSFVANQSVVLACSALKEAYRSILVGEHSAVTYIVILRTDREVLIKRCIKPLISHFSFVLTLLKGLSARRTLHEGIPCRLATRHARGSSTLFY